MHFAPFTTAANVTKQNLRPNIELMIEHPFPQSSSPPSSILCIALGACTKILQNIAYNREARFVPGAHSQRRREHAPTHKVRLCRPIDGRRRRCHRLQSDDREGIQPAFQKRRCLFAVSFYVGARGYTSSDVCCKRLLRSTPRHSAASFTHRLRSSSREAPLPKGAFAIMGG